MTMAAATRNSSPKQRASRSIAAPDNLRLDTLRHHRPERDVGLRADHQRMRFSRFPVLQPGQPVGRGVEDRVVLKLDIDLHPHRIVATDVDGVDEPLVTEMTESVVVDVGASE